MKKMRESGRTLRAIAGEFSISYQRVDQLLKKDEGYEKHVDAPKRLRAIMARATPGLGGCLNLGLPNSKTKYWKVFVGSKLMTASRAVWILKNGPTDLHVLHRCDNPRCVNLEHLFLGTHADNMADKVAKGRCNPRRGKDSHLAKLTEKDVLQIKKLRAAGLTYSRIAAKTGSSIPNIQWIVTGRSWRHVILPNPTKI